MVRPAATSPFALALATAAALSAGCFDTSSSVTTLSYPMLLTVDPSHFRGRLTCGAPGLARYVVTIFNVSEDLPTDCEASPCPRPPTATSIPVLCQHQVSFGEPPLKSQYYYTAIIEGYNRDDVLQKMPGSRDMYDPSSDEIIPPTWTTTCGDLGVPTPAADAEADATIDVPVYNPFRLPTRALTDREVILHGCLPFLEASRPDASVDGGSMPDGAPEDAAPPQDGTFEAGDDATPDGGGPEPEDAAESGGEDGGDGANDVGGEVETDG